MKKKNHRSCLGLVGLQLTYYNFVETGRSMAGAETWFRAFEVGLGGLGEELFS